MEIGFITMFIFVVVFAVSFVFVRQRRDLPPGPPAIPLLGSVWFLWRNSRTSPHEAFMEAAKKYGSVMCVWIGPKPMVILDGFKTIHKAFVIQGSDLNDRPMLSQIRKEMKDGKGVSWSSGKEWRKMRKFTLQHLRSFGFGSSVMEHRIIEEIDKVGTILEQSAGELCNIRETLQNAISNVICSLVFGRKFDYDDTMFQTLLRINDLTLKGQGFSSVTNFIPEFLYPLFPKEHRLYKEKLRGNQLMRDYVDDLIKSHEETFDVDYIRDFLDYYIKVKKETGSVDSIADEPYFNKFNIYRVIADLFLAGSETTSSAIEWCFLYLIEHTEIQTKCRQQIVEAVGERQVQLSDRNQLPYIEATIQEVLRLSNVVPLGVPRTNVERDIYIDGFRIPKNTFVLPNLYSAHMDPGYWKNPYEFNPDRFLDDEGNLLKVESFIPLSIGPRNCLGESLTKMEMFLFISILLQRFVFERDPTATPCDFSSNPEQFITLMPNKYKTRAKPIL